MMVARSYNKMLFALLGSFTLIVSFVPTYSATPSGPPTWGSPDRVWGVRRKPTSADRDRIAAFRKGKTKPVYSTNFTDPEDLKSNWILQSDDNPQLKSCRRPENISVHTGVLKIRTEVATNCKNRWSTGSMWTNFRQKFGFFEARMKTTDVTGINNAFWMVTDDGFEIDIAEVHYPGTVRTTLHNHNDFRQIAGDNNWTKGKSDSIGFNNQFKDNFSAAFHSYGVLWTPNEIIYEVDGEPINIIVTKGAIKGAADIRFSTAVMEYAGKIPVHPENHDMTVNSLRVIALPEGR
jgi:beta-glucanase (GH16 family)